MSVMLSEGVIVSSPARRAHAPASGVLIVPRAIQRHLQASSPASPLPHKPCHAYLHARKL